MPPHSASAVIQHLIHVDFMAVALNEEKKLPTVEGVEERLLDARNTQG